MKQREGDGWTFYRVTSGWQEDVVTADGIETIGHSIVMTFPGSLPYEEAKAKLHRICDEQRARLAETRPGAKRKAT